MPVIGETLRRERLKRNLGLDEISRELKISPRFLEAIEDEQFDKLPRGVFAKSFVRQYARLLGLDEEELAGAVEPAPAGPAFSEQTTQSLPEIHVPRVEAWENVADSRFSRSSSLPAVAMVVVAMLVCSGVYALWQRMHRPVPPPGDVPVPAQQQSRLPHNEPAAQPPVSSATDQPLSARTQPPSVPAQPPAPSPTARPPREGPAAGAPESKPAVSPPAPGNAPTSPVPAPQQEPVANPNAPVRVAVTADEMVWVLVRTDGKYSFSGTLEANQTRTFDGNGSVMLRLGNAGGVSIKLNGQAIPAVGPKGQVRTVQFTSGGFQIVAAPKPSLPLDDLL